MYRTATKSPEPSGSFVCWLDTLGPLLALSLAWAQAALKRANTKKSGVRGLGSRALASESGMSRRVGGLCRV